MQSAVRLSVSAFRRLPYLHDDIAVRGEAHDRGTLRISKSPSDPSEGDMLLPCGTAESEEHRDRARSQMAYPAPPERADLRITKQSGGTNGLAHLDFM